MAKATKISWAHSTFNPWIGCEKVSPACLHCYAEGVAKRMGKELWGAEAPRFFTGEAYWREALRWNEEAGKRREPWRVFCGSLCDVMEDRRDLDERREQLFELIEETPNLTWLLLTKRPENFLRLTPEEWASGWPRNVWAMTTVENQRRAEERLPHLLKVPAAVRGVSAEPLLGPVDLSPWLLDPCACNVPFMDGAGQHDPACPSVTRAWGIDWVIVGGESGGGSRAMHPGWARALRDQCSKARVAFHFKQWGNWAPHDGQPVKLESLALFNKHENGDRPIYIRNLEPDRREDWSEYQTRDDVYMFRTTVKEAGRLLDGRLWDQTPQSMVVPL
jgi:protein gp37